VARPATGCAQWDPKRRVWVAIITLVTGERVKVTLPTSLEEWDLDGAKAAALDVSRRTRERGFAAHRAASRVKRRRKSAVMSADEVESFRRRMKMRERTKKKKTKPLPILRTPSDKIRAILGGMSREDAVDLLAKIAADLMRDDEHETPAPT
jgi:hypothetical protein